MCGTALRLGHELGFGESQPMKLRLADVEPALLSPCPCGSGLKFENCCKPHYSRGPYLEARSKLAAGNYLEGLKCCRAQLTWYILCHRTHTVPWLKTGDPKARVILDVDIKALESGLELLYFAYRVNEIVRDFGDALDCYEHLIPHQSWTDVINYFRAWWLEHDQSDLSEAKAKISQIDIEHCQNSRIIGYYLSLKSSELSVTDRVNLCDRMCSLSTDESTRMHYSCQKGMTYLRICEAEKAIQIIEASLNRYRATPQEGKSQYGDHYFAHGLVFLDQLKQDAEPIREAAVLFQSFLEGKAPEPISQFAVAEHLRTLGECDAILGDYETAIKNFEASLSALDDPLTRIFLARALCTAGKAEGGRNILQEICKDTIPLVTRYDYAMALAALAAVTRKHSDIDAAIEELKALEDLDPHFSGHRDKLLITMLQTTPQNNPGAIKRLLNLINRYITINPSLFGVGINVNKILEDMDVKEGHTTGTGKR